jgi:hypothetical protein
MRVKELTEQLGFENRERCARDQVNSISGGLNTLSWLEES